MSSFLHGLLRVLFAGGCGFLLWHFSIAPLFAEIYYYKDPEGRRYFTNVPTSPRFRPFLGMGKEALKNYDGLIRRYAKKYGLDTALVKAVIKAESEFDPKAVSCVGAAGLMQLMPGTASDMDVNDPFEPSENIEGGCRYLRTLLDRFRTVHLALAAYNAGPENVSKYNGIPPFKETRGFVTRVMRYYSEFN
ncbi:MAG: lytic transglycosylase domain-containing protein [Deltaproteobacteria bacterium]|nr:lytic transglycosylase domain-containing protein [Deltaproteobacteria bacterium]